MIKARKNILPVLKLCVSLQRSNKRYGMRTVGESCRPFLYPHINKCQANRLVVCVSSNARKDELSSPEQHRKPFLFNVQKSKAMNGQNQTAGETAIKKYRNAIFEERIAKAQDIIGNTSCALILYYDDEDHLRTYSVCEDGYEHVQLEMLCSAATIAKNAVEDTFGINK